MIHLVIVILNDLSKLPDLLDGWRKIGVPGATVLNSVGGYHIENWLQRVGLGALGKLFDDRQVRQRTLISLIKGDDLLERAISEADEAVGGFDRPHSGILFTFPVSRALGLQKWGEKEKGLIGEKKNESRENAIPQLDKQTTVAEVISALKLNPAIISVEASLPEIVEELSMHPNVQVASVVNEEKRLVGLIGAKSLSNALFLTIFPGEFLSDLEDLEEILAIADRRKVRSAGDIMQKPSWVHVEDTLEHAFHVLRKCELPGIPVVDDHYHVIGYINLVELMLVWLKRRSSEFSTARREV
jgi:predicted transcriptional regulator